MQSVPSQYETTSISELYGMYIKIISCNKMHILYKGEEKIKLNLSDNCLKSQLPACN